MGMDSCKVFYKGEYGFWIYVVKLDGDFLQNFLIDIIWVVYNRWYV